MEKSATSWHCMATESIDLTPEERKWYEWLSTHLPQLLVLYFSSLKVSFSKWHHTGLVETLISF